MLWLLVGGYVMSKSPLSTLMPLNAKYHVQSGFVTSHQFVALSETFGSEAPPQALRPRAGFASLRIMPLVNVQVQLLLVCMHEASDETGHES